MRSPEQRRTERKQQAQHSALEQPHINLPFKPHKLKSIAQALGVEFSEGQTRLEYTHQGIDPINGELVTSVTVWDHRGLIESIHRNATATLPAAEVRFAYRESAKQGFYEVQSTETFVYGQDGQAFPVEKGIYTRETNEAGDNTLERDFIAYQNPDGSENKKLTRQAYRGYPVSGGKTVDGFELIADTMTLAKEHPGFGVRQEREGGSIINVADVFYPIKVMSVNTPVSLFIHSTSVDAQGRVIKFVNNFHPFRPGIDPAGLRQTEFSYDNPPYDRYVSRIVDKQTSLQAGSFTIRRETSFTHRTLSTTNGQTAVVINEAREKWINLVVKVLRMM